MFHRVLVPLDGSAQAEDALPYVCDIARRCDARVILVRVVQPLFVPPLPSFAGPQLSAREHPGDTEAAQAYVDGHVEALSRDGIAAEGVVRHGPVPDEILECAAELQADLVVLVAEEHHGIARWMGKHTFEAVLPRAGVPVLVVPAQRSGRETHGA